MDAALKSEDEVDANEALSNEPRSLCGTRHISKLLVLLEREAESHVV
jgi:hypothetical protein